MTILTLNDDQSRVLSESSVPVIVVDAHGRAVGRIAPLAPARSSMTLDEQIAEAKRQMADDDGYRRDLSEIIADLRKLAPP